MVAYFFDTCAIIELYRKNPKFMKYGEAGIITSIMNKMELYWWALLQEDKELADIFLETIPNNAEIKEEIIPQAMLFRHKHKKAGFAYADAVGYMLAQQHRVKFLTCDKPFEGLPGVEFVK